MLVRIFMGATWVGADRQEDYEFDALPAVGHKLAIAYEDGWEVATVRDIVHRMTDPETAADIAILVSVPVQSGQASDALPLAGLDGGIAKPSGVSVPKTTGPWGA